MQNQLFAELNTRFAAAWRRHPRAWATFVAAVGYGVLGLLFNACSSMNGVVMAPPEVPGATFMGNPSCVECHSNYTRIFAASPHARIHLADASLPGQTGCESCHGPGSKHVAMGGGKGRFIVNPGRKPDACFQCHLQSHAEFNLPQHHPVIEGRMNCVQCHDPHGADAMKPSGGLAMARLNESCAQCHREQARPFVFEHEAMREGCTACHNPHGSMNAKMLTQADSNLCLRCHAQSRGPAVASGEIFIGRVPHGAFMQFGSCWSAGCHTAVHGSNLQPRMLF